MNDSYEEIKWIIIVISIKTIMIFLCNWVWLEQTQFAVTVVLSMMTTTSLLVYVLANPREITGWIKNIIGFVSVILILITLTYAYTTFSLSTVGSLLCGAIIGLIIVFLAATTSVD